jgi:pyrroloquinoline quinone biosynthesis protein D
MSLPTSVAGPTVNTQPRVAPGLRLQWEPAQNCHVLLYPEGMVKLNDSAGEIMKRCDGQRTVLAITQDIEATHALSNLQADVLAFVGIAGQQKWLTWA